MVFTLKLSKGFLKKLMNIQFKEVKQGNWLKTVYYYVIDSKFRTKKRLDKFLKEQFKDPCPEVIKLARSLRGQDADTTIVNILKWVKKNIHYTRDKDNFGKIEYWANGDLTYSLGRDDCDGLNGLIYYMARLAGIGHECLYCAIGNVKNGGGHFWVLYFSPRHNKLVTIDSTYYYSSRRLIHRQPFKLGDKYKSIWYIFNEEGTYRPK